VKVTTIAPTDPQANVFPAGIHTDIVGKAKFSNQESARFSLRLFKENQESEYYILAWNYEGAL